MRIALLSALEQADSGELRAFLKIGGRAIIAWQADLALRLGAERIICLAQSAVPELIELQREIEGRGKRFQLIRGPLQLVSLVSADQEILVFADGLVVDPELAEAVVAKTRGVAALPAEEGIAAGFERIDADRAWGGLLATRANIVERLADMPPDADTVSLLLRLTLQSGTQVILLDKQRLASGELILAQGEGALAKRETALLDRAAVATPWTAPGIALAHRLARRLSPGALERGPMGGLAAGIAFGLGAIGLSISDYKFAALLLVALATFALVISLAFRDLSRRLRGIVAAVKEVFWINVLIDILLISVLVLPSTLPMLARALFLPVLLIGLLRLGTRLPHRRVSAFLSDRILLALALAPAAWFGVLPQAMALASLVVLALLLWRGQGSRITGD